MSKMIVIRLQEKDQEALEIAKEKHGHDTNTQTIRASIQKYAKAKPVKL